MAENWKTLALKNLELKGVSDCDKEEDAEGREALMKEQYETKFDKGSIPYGA